MREGDYPTGYVNGGGPSFVSTMRIIVSVASLGLAALFIWIAFYGAGGLQYENGYIWLAVVALAANVVAFSVFTRGLKQLHGTWFLLLVSALVIFIGLSFSWSLIPSSSWREFNRAIALLAILAAGIASVRIWSKHWSAVLWALVIFIATVVGYALLTKVAPAWFAPDEVNARLRAPFNYWNATGLSAVFGILLALWLGTAKQYSRLLTAAAFPLMGLCTVALLFSYSRGALFVGITSVVLWFILAKPVRLRGLSVFISGTSLSVLVAFWAFSQDSLTNDRVPLADRVDAGVQLGLLLLLLVVVLYAIGLSVDWMARNRSLSMRVRARIGKLAVGALVVAPIAVVLALGLTHQVSTGSIGSLWSSLTSEESKTPPNEPSRLTNAASVRATYWRESIRIWNDYRLLGAGAGSYEFVRMRYRNNSLYVALAHGRIFQSLADLGIVGALLLVIAALSWCFAAVRTLELKSSKDRISYSHEKLGIIAMVTLILAFGQHMLIDWTWYIPGLVVPVVFIAGWVAGRGKLSQALDLPSLQSGNDTVLRAFAAVVVVVAAVAAMWSIYLPVYSEKRAEDALRLLNMKKYAQAEQEARKSNKLDPTSVQPYFLLSKILRGGGDKRGGLTPLIDAVRMQPANAETWNKLGIYQLVVLSNPNEAVEVFSRALFLDPEDKEIRFNYLTALQALDS